MVLKKREKILIFLAGLAISVWAFDQFYYTPQRRKIESLKNEIRTADLKLKESSLFTQGLETIEAEVTRLETELQRLSSKMLRGEEFRAFLKHLGTESNRLQMKMVSMTTREEASPLEDKKSPSGFQYRKVAIDMVLHTGFHALRTYLQEIEDLPFLVSVEHLQVERMPEKIPLLKVTMGLSVFLVL